METLVSATGLSKRYGKKTALDGVDLSIHAGEIVGLIGPNGAGKSTLLKCLLGLVRGQGDVNVLGHSPHGHRSAMLRSLSYIADVASLPEWIAVNQLLSFMEGVHERFDRSRAEAFLNRTEVEPKHRVKALSKGMKTQLHLGLILGIDSKLLILDEPTLGLDVLFRTDFYDTLVQDYFTPERAILLTTHQVEEIEDYLTRVVFINRGKIIMDLPKAEIADRYQKLTVDDRSLAAAASLRPLHKRSFDNRHILIFENGDRARLSSLGETSAPNLTDLFVATVRGEHDH